MSRGVVLVLAAALLVFGATQLRNMRVDALPEFSPPTAEVQTEALGLSSRELTPIEVSVLARWTIRPRLMGVPGVANGSSWGQRERQVGTRAVHPVVQGTARSSMLRLLTQPCDDPFSAWCETRLALRFGRQ
jgi:Cu/Ag efflux pump CusA